MRRTHVWQNMVVEIKWMDCRDIKEVEKIVLSEYYFLFKEGSGMALKLKCDGWSC
jgi:hypothetical protein